jgi:hypothetical protein
MSKLSVIVHENDEVTVRDERGIPVVCKDCRFAGWLTEYEFHEYSLPRTCLHHSGGADPEDGDRVVFDEAIAQWSHDARTRNWREEYPLCSKKNERGNCNDFVRAKPVSWWRRLFGRRKMRE